MNPGTLPRAQNPAPSDRQSGWPVHAAPPLQYGRHWIQWISLENNTSREEFANTYMLPGHGPSKPRMNTKRRESNLVKLFVKFVLIRVSSRLIFLSAQISGESQTSNTRYGHGGS